MVLPADGARSTPRILSDQEELAILKRANAKARQEAAEKARRAEEQKAAAETKKTRKEANKAVKRYDGHVRDHQDKWVRRHGQEFRNKPLSALQKAWEAAWRASDEGKAAEKELAPYLTAYDLAVQKELRLAAETSPEALKSKLKDIKGLDKSGSRADRALDDIAGKEAEHIGRETPALRSAAQTFLIASTAWDAAQKNPAGSGYDNAKAAFETAKADYARELSDFFGDKIETAVYAGKPLDKVTAGLKAEYDGQFDSIIDFEAGIAKSGQAISKWLDDYKANPAVTPLSDAERKLLAKDPTTLAFLKLSGVSIDPGALSKEELALAETSPVLFGILQKGGVRIRQGVDVPIVEIGGTAVTLSDANRQAYEQGGLTGLGRSLRQSGQVKLDPAAENLLLGTSIVRGDVTQQHVDELMGQGKDQEALAALSASMDAALSPEERQDVLTEAGLAHFGPGTGYWDNQIDGALAAPGDTSQGRYADWDADKVGRLLQTASENAPPELLDDLLDRVKARYQPEWLKGNGTEGSAVMSGVDWAKGLSMATAVADLIPGHARTLEFAQWIAGMPAGPGNMLQELSSGGYAPVREAIKDGASPTLFGTIVQELKTNGDAYDSKIVDFVGRDLPGVLAGASEPAFLKAARADYQAFQDNKTEMLQTFFDPFLDMPTIGKPIGTQNSPELRNTIGKALGLAPTQNLDAAQRGDMSVDWYGPGSSGSLAARQWEIIALSVAWIDDQDDENSEVTILPLVYAAKTAGLQHGALFTITRSDGTQVVIDGSQADDAIDLAEAQNRTIDLLAPDKDAFVNWHFTSRDDFIDHNDYDTDGRIYIVDDWSAADRDGDHHVDISRYADGIAAACVTGKERRDQITDYAAMGVGLVAGIALAPVTAGGSLLATGLVGGALLGSVGWQAYRGFEVRSEMERHGQSSDWANPAARDTYIQQGLAVLSLVPAGLMTRAIWLTRTGAVVSKMGAAAGDSALAARGASLADAAARPARFARWTGIGTTIPAVGLTVKQASAMAENWDGMSEGEQHRGLTDLALNVVTLGVGSVAARTPGLARRLAANPRLTKAEQIYLANIGALRSAASRDISLEEGASLGSWQKRLVDQPDGGQAEQLFARPATSIRVGRERFDELRIYPETVEPAPDGPNLEWQDPVYHGPLLADPAASGGRPRNGRKLLVVLPHPDDDSMFAGFLMRAFSAGYDIEFVALTGGDSGTQYTTRSGIPREKRDATGQEATDPVRYQKIRLKELRGALHLYGAPEDVQITFLQMPDVNPWRFPLFRYLRYARFAQWNPEAVVKFIGDKIGSADYDAVITTSGDPSGHGAHQEGWRLTTEAVGAFRNANPGAQAPQVLGVREIGWIAREDLEPIPSGRLRTVELSPAEIARKNYALAKAYKSQPPGHFEFNGNARTFEQFVTEEGVATPPALARLFETEHAPLLLDPAASNADGTFLVADDSAMPGVRFETLPAPEITGRPRRVETVAAPPAKRRPAYAGPAAEQLGGFASRAEQWARGEGPQIETIARENEAQFLYLKNAEARHRPDRVTLRQRLGLAGSEEGSFFRGYRRDAVIWVAAAESPVANLGAEKPVILSEAARPWRNLDGAREFAVQNLAATRGEAKVWYLYRVVGPARRLAAAVDAGRIAPELIEGVLAVREKGALSPETFVNTQARYAPRPGEEYTAPPPRGLTRREWLTAGVKTGGVIGLNAAGVYAGYRLGFGLGHVAAMEGLINTGLAMFGLRATIGGAKEIAQTRFAIRLDEVGSAADGRPGLSRVQRQTAGWRRIARGITRAQGDRLLLQSSVLKANARDGDALNALEDTALFEPQSPLAKALDVVQTLSYGANDAAGSRVLTNLWLDPQSNMLTVSFRSLSSTGQSLEHVATVGFVPVHLLNNAGTVWPRFLGGRRAWRYSRHGAVQPEGVRWRGYYAGNEGKWLKQLLHGLGDPKAAAYPERLLEGVKVQKAPLTARIKQYAMGGATVAAVPFMAADFTRAAEAFASGHPVMGLIQTGMGAFDWMFFRAFQQTYVDTFRANHGLGETRRQNRFVDAFNRPVKGAETNPADPAKPRLVKRGFLKTFAPAIVLAFGMDGRVILGFAAQTEPEQAQQALSTLTSGLPPQWPGIMPIPASGSWRPGGELQQSPPASGDLARMTPQEFAEVLKELGYPQVSPQR